MSDKLTTMQLKRNFLAQQARITKLKAENAELKQELEAFQSLIDLQHRRTIEADKLWQKANNKPGNVFPDLGELIRWLMEEINNK